MQRLVGITVRVTALTIVALLCAIAPAAAQSADLEVFLQKFPINNGEPTNALVTYLLDVWNFGPNDAEHVVLTDVLPQGATFESTSTDGCSYDDGTRTFTCVEGTLTPDTGFSADLVVRTPSTPTTMVNTVQAFSTTPDPNSANNSSSLTINVVVFELSDLAVTMRTSASSVLVHRAASRHDRTPGHRHSLRRVCRSVGWREDAAFPFAACGFASLARFFRA